jgi:hypothetical protein
MLATPVAELPAEPGWAFGPKWDGYRGIATLGNGQVSIASRRGLDMAAGFTELQGLADALDGHQVVLDGELVALDPAGRPDFTALQQRVRARGRQRRRAATLARSSAWSLTCCGWTASCSPGCRGPSGGRRWRPSSWPGPLGRRSELRRPGPGDGGRDQGPGPVRGDRQAPGWGLPAGPAPSRLAQARLASRPSLSSAATCLARSGWSGCCSAPWTSAVACATSPVSRPAWSRPRPAVHRDA